MINDSDGRSCILFLTAGLTPVHHVLWQCLGGSSGKRFDLDQCKIFSLFFLDGGLDIIYPSLFSNGKWMILEKRNYTICSPYGADPSAWMGGQVAPQVCVATWMAGTRSLALIDSSGHLGVIEHTGNLTQLELSGWVRDFIPL